MAALVGKLASSDIAQKLASSSLGQSIIDKVAPNADALQAKMLQRGGPPGPPGPPGPKLPGVGSGIDTLPITSKIEKGIGKVVELKDKFDGKLDSYYWTLRIVLVLVVVTVISIIIYKYKLPLICYGCESPNLLYNIFYYINFFKSKLLIFLYKYKLLKKSNLATIHFKASCSIYTY
jgi:hypothetical protein